MPLEFEEEITTQESLRAILGEPAERTKNKVADRILPSYARFIAASSFVFVASRDARGALDISPKGDPAGFAVVLDPHTIAIPDRLGNRRGDTFENLLVDPGVGLIFLVPGHGGTLRVKGRGRIVRDRALQDRLAYKGKQPDLVLVVDVEAALVHCPKCMIRSRLWEPEAWADPALAPTSAEMMLERAPADATEADMETAIADSVRDWLY